MKSSNHAPRLLFLIGSLAFLLTSVTAQQPRSPQSEEVVRVNTDLVQTAITVVDKNGRFVDGLNREQFELTIDGKPRPISFFERVTAGSSREAQILAGDANVATDKPANSNATIRGRTVVFFIDDMHMSAESLHRTRDMLRHFLESEMNPRDSVAIASASGQVGFLQQFTNSRDVLSAAIERLSPRQDEIRSYGTGNTKMREFDALTIDTISSSNKNNEVLNYYIRECVVQSNPPKLAPPVARAAIAASCESEVRNSARVVLMQSGTLTLNMYAALESLMRSSARLPGRKLAFFVSDGFLLDDGPHAPDLRGKLDTIIDTAQRAGVVVYSIDSRGLINDKIDLSQGNARMDFGAPVGEIEAHQDAMNALAGDTGGRALRNQSYFDRWVDKVLDETSNYYLLAWRPDKEEEKTPKFRNIKVSLAGHPELTARAPRGYFTTQPEANNAGNKSGENQKATTAEAALRDALTDIYPTSSLPTLLSLTYLNTPKNETVLTSSIQIASRSLNYGEDGKQPAAVKLAGVILTDKGKIASSFRNQLNVNPLEGESYRSGVIYNQHTPMAPGIYQVRVAARDEKTGRVGSAMQWVVIPDLATHQLALSSVLLGGQVLEDARTKDGSAQVQLSVDHRFVRSASLGYWIFVYNAKRNGGGTPSLTVQTRVLQNGQLIVTAPRRSIVNGAPDPERIPYGEQLSLSSLAPGKYDLQVTITDTIAGTSVTQSIDFEVL
jgi:VWFA-related protein